MSDFTKQRAAEYEKLIAEVKSKIKGNKTLDLPGQGDYFLNKFIAKLAKSLEKEIGSPDNFWIESIDLKEPPAHVNAHVALSVFRAAEKLGRSPADLSREILETLKKNHPKEIAEAEIAGPFLNIQFDQSWLTDSVLNQVKEYGDRYGWSDMGGGKLMLIDYSHPNIAKPIGIGHIRSTIIGQAVVNLYAASGWRIIKDNFLGDWGSQFGKLLVALKHWGPKDRKPEELALNELKDLYVKYHQEEESDEELGREAALLAEKLENGDEELVKLWESIRKTSIEGFNKMYQRLGVEFDMYAGESYFIKGSEQVLGECVEKGICQADKDSEAIVADNLDGLPSLILKKSDGTSLYIGRDIASIKKKIEDFSPDESLFAVGDEQALRFKQLFALVKKMGYAPNTELVHVGFGMVLVDGKKMSTRKGSLVDLEELLNQATQKADALLKEKGHFENDKDRQEAAEVIGVGAVIYNDLRQTRTHNISFDWDRMLDIQGGSSVYLQYTYARIRSVEEKLQAEKLSNTHTALKEKSEINILLSLARFPVVVKRAQLEKAPHHIANYLEGLAQDFNTFYGEVRIIDTEDEKLKATRQALLGAVAQTIKNGLQLLNIKVLSRL